ncbi:HAD-IIIC family phosphatase [Sinomicrobium oceani]|uniref:HAD-IIIC family phosphatase n=1 Tax=Sinomicrobium oceani TaxID=1150368 RepID=UPI00227B4C29|nr:HAD-IIIC family phosphatase [Sinomicrobium oceani]
MFEFKWKDKKVWLQENQLRDQNSQIRKKSITGVLGLLWEEHCVECAIPECYDSCSLYSRRSDGACRRLEYGIYPNKNFNGHYTYGADVKFRKWGKIEANLQNSYLIHTKSVFGRLININYFKNFFKKNDTHKTIDINTFDEFVIECYSANPSTFKLILEYFELSHSFRKTRFRKDLIIKEGYNLFRIPFDTMGIVSLKGYIFLSPEQADSENRMVFTWLDFVKYKKVMSALKNEDNPIQNKIKCVVWDLDNTMWEGVLIDNKDVEVKRDALELVKWLDSKGIIQTIISKNTFDSCWSKLKELQIDEYFLFPEINWEPKSNNLAKIIKKLNIGVNSLAIIDDSQFEREEILSRYPEVNVYNELEIKNISEYPEFKVQVSKEGKNRREKYLLEDRRRKIKQQFKGTYEEFLISCKMQLKVFIPTEDDHIERCYELIQRSNQLNLSTRRYTQKEFTDLLNNDYILPLAIHCEDRYGDYGIVGFSSISFNKTHPYMKNLVISCRVAQKKVEHTLIYGLGKLFRKNGYKKIQAGLVITAKNGPLVKVFQDLPFKCLNRQNNLETLSLDLNDDFDMNKIIELKIDKNVSSRVCSSNYSAL